jgi:hypothetical protein
MPHVLTTGSNVTCGHSGTVSTASTAKLKVNGQPVLLKEGIQGRSVAGCTTPPASDISGPTAKPCTLVSTVSAGAATKLKVSGQSVMLQTLAGATDGMVAKETPQKLLSADAGQVKLTSM